MQIDLKILRDTDVEQIVELANNKLVSDGMSTLPVPFTEADAAAIVRRSNENNEVVRGIIESENDLLCGVVMLRDFEPEHKQAEMSIWIGEPFWGRGIGTAAIVKMAIAGFNEFSLNRIYAYCMVRNVASRRILEKSGFSREGLLRDRVIKNDVFEDVYIYAILKRDM